MSVTSPRLRRSWQPIDPADTVRLIETQALAELGKKGLLRLEKAKFAELAEADYSLILEGRFIEDAGKFTVYLTFSPQKKSDAPSLYVLDTDEVENKSVPEMQKIITALVQRAARRLNSTLEPHLASIGTIYDAGPDPQALPLQWGELDVPRLQAAKGAAATLVDVRNDDSSRFKAMAELKGHVFDQPAARQAVELCVLYEPKPSLGSDCVSALALAPVARTRVETQRLLLYAMRNDVDGNVVQTIANVSKGFVGLSRKEALATWMQVLADDASPAEAASNIAQMLADENNVPHLELALSKCLAGEALVYGKRQACAGTLLRKLPPERRRAVAIRYLQQAKVLNGGGTGAFDDVMENIRPAGRERLDPQLANLLSEVMLSPRFDLGRHKILYALREHPAPDAALTGKLLIVAKTRRFADDAFHTISELAGDVPDYRPIAIERLKRFDAGITYMAYANHGDPKKELAEVIKRLEKRK